MAELDKRLIPNYIFAGATIAVFLWAAVFSLLNADTLVNLVEVEDPKTALVIGGVGGSILTALIVVSKDIYQFFFRTSPTE